MATTIQSDIRSALHMASSTFRSLSPNLILSRAAARRALPYYSSSSPTATTKSSLILRAFSSADSASDVVLKVPEKPSMCTADELHYVSVPSCDWRLALWRYHPSPQAPPRNHPLLLLSGVGTNAIGYDLSPESSFARYMSGQGFDTWILEVRGAGLSVQGSKSKEIKQSAYERSEQMEAASRSTTNGAFPVEAQSTIPGALEESETFAVKGEESESIAVEGDMMGIATVWDESRLVMKLTETFMRLSERLSGFLSEGQSRIMYAKFFDQISKLLVDSQLSERFNEIREKLSNLLETRQNSSITNQIWDLSQRIVSIIEEGQRSVSPPLFDLQERLASTIEDFQKQLDLIVKYDWDFDHYLEEDVPAAMEYIIEESRPKDGKLLAIGHSMGGILLYATLSRCAFEGRDSRFAAIVTLASSLDYMSSKSTLKLLLPLADPAQALNVPVVPLGALLAAAYPLSSRPPYVLSWLNYLISAEDMMHPELLEKLILNNFCTIPANLILQLTTAFREGGLRDRSGTFSYKDHIHKINVPVLALAGDRDFICPPEAVVFEQFHRVAYIYFLAIVVLNQLPQLAVFGRGVSILPLAFVLLVTAVKDAYEDSRRHRSDRIENNRLASVLVNGQFQPKKSKDIRVGEIIRIQAEETIPCDMVLLSTSDPTGVAYVQTINLDGESNLKTRYAKQETLLKMPDKERVGGLIKCEKPNRNIYGFHANMEIDGKKLSLGPSNILLRGCQIKNTEWALGVAVYAGRDTKAMLNSSGAPSKRSRLETHMNFEIIILSVFLVTLCTVVSICAVVWLLGHGEELDYLPYFRKADFSGRDDGDYNYYGWGLETVFTFLMSVIVFQIMIPISLYISMELVRVGQAYFMIRDSEMYDEASNSRFQCRALNINEDLGQVKYVFSDKTGTLTENKMEFQCASIWGIDYSGGNSQIEQDEYSVKVEGKVLRPKMKVKTDPGLLQISESKTDTKEGKHVHDFFLALAACNTIVPLVVDTPDPTVKRIDYQGESPDEQALVYAAAAYGFMLIERTSGYIVIDIQGRRQRFNVLGLHEFDSDRKRMSVILGCPDNSVKVFVKGADTTMFSVIDKSLNKNVIRATEAHLHAYSSLGLRTLVVGMRELSASEFEQWHSSFEAASTALIGRAALLRKVAGSVENNLSLLGASGIEDKLQEGVPEAIECLRTAGIKVWVLTGDKQETAISIGYSSKLLTRKMTQIIINSNSKESCRRGLEDAIVMSKKLMTVAGVADNAGGSSEARSTPLALIIDGTSLVYILDSELEEQLFRLASECSVVLCCRVAPLQKAGIVALVKNWTADMTLAIGDGANDVSMIQMADVGVGISGQEGRQAVMASDFSMGQFRFLVPLLLVHGHWNYQRMGYMILYNFYRNAVMVFVLFWYVLFTCFTLTTAINEWSSMLYSIIYTSLPTIVVGILDKDLSRRSLLKYPQLYGTGHRQESYNTKLFWITMLDTLWQSVAIFFIPLFAYWHSTIDISSIGDLWILAVVILVNIHLAMDVMRWTWLTHAAIWGSIIATFICVIVLDAIPDLIGYWAFFSVAKTGTFWLCLLAIVIAGIIPRFVVKFIYQYYSPSDVQIAREVEKFGDPRELGTVQIEMNPILDPQRR